MLEDSKKKSPRTQEKAKASLSGIQDQKNEDEAQVAKESKAKPSGQDEAQVAKESKAKPSGQGEVQVAKESKAKPSGQGEVQVAKESKAKPSDKGEVTAEAKSQPSVKLEGLFAFKMSMSAFYNDKGERIPVTALKYEPCRVSQIKTKEKESYQAVQLAFLPQKNKRCSKALIRHLSSAGFKEGARFVREIRQDTPEGLKVSQEVAIESFQKGDRVKISAVSKGKGFTGVVKKWNFSGGRASHGSKIHRGTGSIGQCTQPSRVMPGRKMPGRHGFKKVSRLNVPVVDVVPEERMIFIKGPVPGARGTLVFLRKMQTSLLASKETSRA